jgi:hypothetical protein
MNLKQINLFREIIMYYQASDISRSSKLNVKYAKEILDDLENRIPNDRQIELQSNIIDFEYHIKKHQHSYDICNLLGVDDSNDTNCIENHRDSIEEAEKELQDISLKKVSS